MGRCTDLEQDLARLEDFSRTEKLDSKALFPAWNGKGDLKRPVYRNLCLLSVIFAFSVGLFIGILIPLVYFRESPAATTTAAENVDAIKSVFVNNSYGVKNTSRDLNEYPTVSFIDGYVSKPASALEVVEDGVYWGRNVERSIPAGYDEDEHSSWASYVAKNTAVKLENGCGRMQNRMVTFQDGSKACVRYRQNTDQIQGELFSFYLARVLKLQNLAPSVVSVVNLKSPLWKNLGHDITSAQWNSNKPIVLTKYIPNLDAAGIPPAFRPAERHLNKHDVGNMTAEGSGALGHLVELAQWSDLIVFDYLTANLDRVVNNLYNYQWNVNIMDAPAHNLARATDTDLLVFLDNESGLLHGYRLLQKYEIYHAILLDNLCVFRRRTADVVKRLRRDGNVGALLREMFDKSNGARVKDVLPTLPDKSVKILNERIAKVHDQIRKCEAMFRDGGRRT